MKCSQRKNGLTEPCIRANTTSRSVTHRASAPETGSPSARRGEGAMPVPPHSAVSGDRQLRRPCSQRRESERSLEAAGPASCLQLGSAGTGPSLQEEQSCRAQLQTDGRTDGRTDRCTDGSRFQTTSLSGSRPHPDTRARL